MEKQWLWYYLQCLTVYLVYIVGIWTTFYLLYQGAFVGAGTALIGVLAFLYYRLTSASNYWQEKGIPYVKNKFPFGFLQDTVLGKKSSFETWKKLADEMGRDTKFYGTFFMGNPILIIQDPDIVKQVLVKDFDHFVDRTGIASNMQNMTGTRTDEIWLKQMQNAMGDKWKDIRSTFSPIFTSGKMKLMTSIIKTVCQEMVGKFEELSDNGTTFDAKDIMGKFSLAAIASCAYGVDIQAFQGESDFVKHALTMFAGGKISHSARAIKFFIQMLPFGPKFLGMLGISVNPVEETDFFYRVVEETIRHRNESKERRNDLIDLMLDAIKNENMEEEETKEQFDLDSKFKHTRKEVGEEELIATAMVMLVAGYETTAFTLAHCLYELAMNQNIQKKLQEEIDQAYEDAAGDSIDYMTIQNLPFLDMVVYETLRFHLFLPNMIRECTKEWKIPGTDTTVKPMESIFVNIMALHFNPRYYPNPEEFDPNNFSKDNTAARHPYTFLTFGQGPRSCLGKRFSLLEMKLALAAMLHKFTVLPCEETPEKIEFLPSNIFLLKPKRPLVLKVERRQN